VTKETDKDSKPSGEGELLPAVKVVRSPPALLEADVLETDFEKPRRLGLMVAFLTFGVFGLWSALAPIEGAVHAGGLIAVKNYKKVVQHLEGGIVEQILVQNGDRVAAGDILLVLDGTQRTAELEIANTQLAALLALEARLIAERDDQATVVYPQSLFDNDTRQASAEIASQDQVFATRKAAREGAVAVLNQRISQLESRISGLQAMRESKNILAASYADELTDLRSLVAEGFADKLRLREVERSHAVTSGEAAELAATIAATEIQIGETRLEIIQHQNEFQSEVANQLAETQTSLKDTRERVTALTDVVSRTLVRAPVDGVVNGLQIHTEGGVIPPGNVIAEIVPQSEELVIDARVAAVDIDRVQIGQHANVRLSAFNTRTVPTMDGTVIGVSADAAADENTGQGFYTARIEIDPASLANLDQLELVPGMPAEIFITTGSRTFLQYLMNPLTNALARSFIEE